MKIRRDMCEVIRAIGKQVVPFHLHICRFVPIGFDMYIT